MLKNVDQNIYVYHKSYQLVCFNSTEILLESIAAKNIYISAHTAAELKVVI